MARIRQLSRTVGQFTVLPELAHTIYLKMIRYHAERNIELRHESDGWGMLVDPTSETSFALNELGVFIWERLQQHTTVADVVKAVALHFSYTKEDKLQHDVEAFIENLVAEKLASKYNTDEVMPFPVCAYIALTRKCNQTCSYCNYLEYAELGEDRPTSEWIQFINCFHKLGGEYICLSGGEPFLFADIGEFLAQIQTLGLKFSILSNGTFLPQSIIPMLSSPLCNYIQISLDGASASVHEYCRSIGSFSKALQTCTLLTDLDIPVIVRVALTPANMCLIPDMARFYLDDLGVEAIHFSWLYPIGRGKNTGEEHSINAKNRTAVLETVQVLFEHYGDRIKGTAGPLADIKQWGRMCDYIEGIIDTLPYKGGFLSGCGCTKHMLSVRSDGCIVPCILLQNMVIGDIRDDLSKVWNTSHVLKFLRQREDIPLRNFSKCAACRYVDACTGDCPAIPYVLHGTLNTPNEFGCLSNFLHSGGVLPRNARNNTMQ